MGPNPFFGVLCHWIGGFASATNFIPFRGIKRWSWEVYWLLQGIAAWLIAPIVCASLLVPHLGSVLGAAPPESLVVAVLFGALWGVGGLAWGLAIRHLGLALGYAASLGLANVFATLLPPIFHGQITLIMHETSGPIRLAGAGLCGIAAALCGAAGLSKEKEITPAEKAEAGERDFSCFRGILMAALAGLMSAFFAFGLDAGAPLAAIARCELLDAGRSGLWANLPVLAVVLCGGFLTNFIWTSMLFLKNRSAGQLSGQPGTNPMRASSSSGHTLMDFNPADLSTLQRIARASLVRNYLLAAAAGVIGYLQFFFSSIGEKNGVQESLSDWTRHGAGILLFATLWGLLFKEWKATGLRTRALAACGLALLIGGTLVLGYGDDLRAREDGASTARVQQAAMPAR